MEITVNGQRREVATARTLAQLLDELKVQAHTGVAVLRNGEIVRRADWPRQLVQPDDQLEIVRATVGGV